MKKDAMKDQGYFCCYGSLCSFLESSMTFILIGEKLDGHHRPYTSNDSWKNSDYVTYFFFSLFSLLWSWKSDSSITYFNSYTLFKCLAHEVTFIMVENHWKSIIILQHCERSEQSFRYLISQISHATSCATKFWSFSVSILEAILWQSRTFKWDFFADFQTLWKS